MKKNFPQFKEKNWNRESKMQVFFKDYPKNYDPLRLFWLESNPAADYGEGLEKQKP